MMPTCTKTEENGCLMVMDTISLFVLVLTCFALCQCISVERKPRSLSLQLEKGIPEWNIVAKGRHKRSAQSCGSKDVLEYDPQELNEKAEAIQAVWVGRDEILIIASDKVLKGHSTVWRGTYKSIGIFTFKQDETSIQVPVMPDTLQVSPAGDRATVVVVSLNRRYLFVSRDFGRTWNRYKTPTQNFNPTDELYLSGRNPQHMVIRSRSGELWVSDSGGHKWNFITRRVQLVEFAQVDDGVEYVYYSISSGSQSFNPLYRMDIASRHTTIVDNSAYRFRVDNNFLFISRKNSTGNKEADSKSRRLYVTNNYVSDKIKFKEVQLPSLKDEQFYAVMATHETGAFIHVYQGTEEIFGNLYVSDSTGSRFTLSLTNHLYKVYRHPLGQYSVHDFYEVASMRGVYITTVVDNDLNGHVTKITFDNGGMWRRLTAPPGTCHGSPCSLHLHLRYTQLVSPFFNSSAPKGPLSVASSPMVIIAHGSVGGVRKDNGKFTKVYLSNDGGYNWKDVGLPVGTYVYGIADYGNIIVIAPDGDSVEQIWFSHDRGDCFSQKTVDTTKVFRMNRGLLFDPSAASLLGFLMGVEGTGQDDEWRIITLNFKSLLTRRCDAKDYHLVDEHSSNHDCLMGYRRWYNLTLTSSICFNERNYNYHPVKQTLCPCNYSDYECDYGFNRASTVECSRQPDFSLSDVCPPGATTYRQSLSGFRLIPGDKCSQTAESKKLLNEQELLCTGNEEDSGYRRRTGSRSTVLTIFLGFLIVVASLVAATVLLYGWLKCRAKELARDKVYYQRLPKEENHKFVTSEDSSSDEDLIAAT